MIFEAFLNSDFLSLFYLIVKHCITFRHLQISAFFFSNFDIITPIIYYKLK